MTRSRLILLAVGCAIFGGCTVVSVTTTDDTGKKRTTWGLQTPIGEVGARATDGSNRRMKIIVEKPEPGTYIQTNSNWQSSPADSGMRYVQTGANYTPREPQYERPSGLQYHAAPQHVPREPRYEKDSGARYINYPAKQPQPPSPPPDSGLRYVQTPQSGPREPQYEKDSGTRYINTPQHAPAASPAQSVAGQRYVQGKPPVGATNTGYVGAPPPGKITGNPAVVLQTYKDNIDRLAKTDPVAYKVRMAWDDVGIRWALNIAASRSLAGDSPTAARKYIANKVSEGALKELGIDNPSMREKVNFLLTVLPAIYGLEQ